MHSSVLSLVLSTKLAGHVAHVSNFSFPEIEAGGSSLNTGGNCSGVVYPWAKQRAVR